MAHHQLLLLLSLEHLAIVQSYRPKRRGRLITLQPIVPHLNQRPTRRPRIQRTTPLAPPSRTTSRKRIARPQRSPTLGRKRTVHRQRSPTLGRSLTEMSLLSGRKLLRRASVRSPSALLLLLRKRSLHRSNHRVWAWFRLGGNTLGIPSFHRVPFFFPQEMLRAMVCDTADACQIKFTLLKKVRILQGCHRTR